MMFEEGQIQDNATAPAHFQGGDPVDWHLSVHWGDAGIAAWSDSPIEPIGALLSDLGPIALADLDAELNGGTPGDHLHAAISTRPGPWFDWYRGIIDPLVRTAAQSADLKRQVAQSLRRALVQAVVR